MNEQPKPLARVKLVQMGTTRNLCAVNTAEASGLGLERRDWTAQTEGREWQRGAAREGENDRNSRKKTV